jgi:hypothetical protein
MTGLLALVVLVGNSQGASSGGDLLVALAGFVVGALPMLGMAWAYREQKPWRRLAATVLPLLQLLAVWLVMRGRVAMSSFPFLVQVPRYALAVQLYYLPAAVILAVLAWRWGSGVSDDDDWQ